MVRGASRPLRQELHRDLITRVNEQLADARSGIRTKAAKAPVGVENKAQSKGAPSTRVGRTATGPPVQARREEAKGLRRDHHRADAREHVPEGTASLRSIAEAHQSIRQKRGAA